MNVPISWLKRYVDVPADTDDLMSKLTAIGHMQDGPAQKVNGDTVYDLEIRQNRADCYSLLGIARETAAAYNTTLKMPSAYDQPLSIQNNDQAVKIKIADEQLCHRFQTVEIKNIQMKESPSWLKDSLEFYGIKSVNLIVDITNYVMVELGQPLHAFDATTIAKQTLIIRPAQTGEKLTVLGKQTIKLTPADLVIADPEKVLALAGVIGGEDSGVNSQTTNIVLEAANYDQASIRRSSMHHDLRTEASTRLEKFLHPQLTELALRRASALVAELANGKVVSQADVYPDPQPEKTVILRPAALARLGGVELDSNTMAKFLTRENIESQTQANGELEVKIPYWRTDLEQEADLVEEILRLYGYENIPSRNLGGQVPTDLQSNYYELEEKVRDLLIASGYNEQITEPLTLEDESFANTQHPNRQPVHLENSLSQAKSMLRTTLRYQLLDAAKAQRKYRQTQVNLFEVGRIYYENTDEAPNTYQRYGEDHVVAALSSGPTASWSKLKGVAETVLIRLGYNPEDINLILSDLSANQDYPTFYLEINLSELRRQQPQEQLRLLSTPAQLIFQDLSLLAPAETAVGQILQLVRSQDELIYSVQLGEQPQSINSDSKSIFLKLAFGRGSEVISTSDVEPVRAKILSALAKLDVVPRQEVGNENRLCN